MAESLGALCIVLHGHLPYVLHHGTSPHGEAWLYEAAAETYLPLLDMIGEVALHNTRPALTVGLTPVLLEQLGSDYFKSGFVRYLKERAERTRRDGAEFESAGDSHFVYLAERWANWYEGRLQHFERIARDIPGEFAKRRVEGHIQILTSNATHAYMPLLLNDAMLKAQMAAGTSTSEKWLGFKSRGMWLPECAYRPSWDQWKPSVLYDDPQAGGRRNVYRGCRDQSFFRRYASNCRRTAARRDRAGAVSRSQRDAALLGSKARLAQPAGGGRRRQQAAAACVLRLRGIRASASRSGAERSATPARANIWISIASMVKPAFAITKSRTIRLRWETNSLTCRKMFSRSCMSTASISI